MSDLLRHPGAVPHCPDCGGLGVVVVRKGARLVSAPCSCRQPTCPACGDEGILLTSDGRHSPCDCARVGRRATRFDQAALPGRYTHATLGSLAQDDPANLPVAQRVREWVEAWDPKDPPPGLVLHGPVGRGKTHYLVAAARSLTLHRGAHVRFVEFSHLIADLKASFDRGQGSAALMDGLGEVDILILDELGKGRQTEFEDQMIDDLISRRYNAGLPVLASTNYTPREATGTRFANNAQPNAAGPTLGDRLGDRVYSRLREMCRFYPLGGDADLRTTSRRARW